MLNYTQFILLSKEHISSMSVSVDEWVLGKKVIHSPPPKKKQKTKFVKHLFKLCDFTGCHHPQPDGQQQLCGSGGGRLHQWTQRTMERPDYSGHAVRRPWYKQIYG